MLREGSADVRQHTSCDGAGISEGGAAEELERHVGREHHQLHMRDHGIGYSEAAGDH